MKDKLRGHDLYRMGMYETFCFVDIKMFTHILQCDGRCPYGRFIEYRPDDHSLYRLGLHETYCYRVSRIKFVHDSHMSGPGIFRWFLYNEE